MSLPSQNYNDLGWWQRRDLRNDYVADQRGLCSFCKSELQLGPPQHITRKPIKWKLFPPNFLKHPIHLHHDHNTGMTLGAVHAYCNAVLWQYHGE